MTQQRARFAWRSYPDGQAITATSSAGNMAASNLLGTNIQLPWQSTTTAAQTLQGQFATLQACDYLCLYAHNLSYDATIRLQLANDSGFTDITYDHTWQAVLPAYGFGADSFGLVPFGGYAPSKQVPYSVFWFDAALAMYWRVVITDTSNPDGYIQVGRLMLGDYWSVENIRSNFNYGYNRALLSTEKAQQTLSGAVYVTEGVKFRKFSIKFNTLSALDEENLHDMIHSCGLSGHILFSAYPELGTSEEQAHTALCRYVSDSGSTRTNFPWRDQSFVFQEVI